jgi:hypothetical protein
MPHWDIGARHQVPASKLTAKESIADGHRLSPRQVQDERLTLAADMVYLILRDSQALAPPAEQLLATMHGDLLALRQRFRTDR